MDAKTIINGLKLGDSFELTGQLPRRYAKDFVACNKGLGLCKWHVDGALTSSSDKSLFDLLCFFSLF